MTLFESFIERDAWTDQVSENSARLAWAWGTTTSEGWGDLAFEDEVEFGLTFTQMPTFSYGFSIVGSDRLVDDRFPRCSGGVYEWRQDGRGFYVGAHVFVTVDTVSPLLAWKVTNAADPAYSLLHHFTFMGIAIKDIGADRSKDS